MTKKLFALLLFGNLYCLAAIQAGMQWDVRTTASNNNGGGYDPTVSSPGTDYSQQDAAQQAYTDIVIGGTTSQITSAAHPFGSTHPGNVINITSGTGCTTGRYEVLSVSGTTATIDRSMGTAASTCTGNLGGSFADLSLINSNGLIVSGNTVWIKSSGNYTPSVPFFVGPGVIFYTGYQTTHGDIVGNTGTRPTITTSTNTTPLIEGGANFASWAFFSNIIFTTTAGTPGHGFDTNGSSFNELLLFNCKLSGFNVHLFGDWNVNWSFNGLHVIGTEITGGTTGISNTAGGEFISSYLHGISGDAFNATTSGHFASPVWIVNSVLVSNGRGVNDEDQNREFYLINDVIANNTGDGYANTSGSAYTSNFPHISNTIFYGNGGWGVNFPSGSIAVTNVSNAYGANTSGARNHLAVGQSDVTLTSNPFTNSAGGDYSLNNTAGGGAALRAAGFPGIMPGATMTSYLDIGAVQHQSSSVAVGGGAYVQ